MNPRIALATSRIRSIVARPGGGIAALTGGGIELFDDALAPAGIIEGGSEPEVDRLVALSRERFVAYGGKLYDGRAADFLGEVDIHESRVVDVIATERGYLAVLSDELLIDREDEIDERPLPGVREHGGVAWCGGAAIAGPEGVAIVDAAGEVRARAKIEATARPVALAGAIAVETERAIVVLDGEARTIGRIPRTTDVSLAAFRAGVLVTDPIYVTYWSMKDGAPEKLWDYPFEHLRDAIVLGDDRIVIRKYAPATEIFDGTGHRLAYVSLKSQVKAACAFGDGIALSTATGRDLVWWRPPGEEVALAHDAFVAVHAAVPGGMATSEGRVLYLWRPGEEVPAVPPMISVYPLGVPLVIDGNRVTVESAGRHLHRAVARDGRVLAFSADRPWRPMTTPDEARARIAAAVADEPARIAALRDEVLPDEAIQGGLPFEELAEALGIAPRCVRAHLQMRAAALAPPRRVVGYDYLGAFTTEGTLHVGDPIYIGRSTKADAILPLFATLAAVPGRWHVFARDDEDGDTSELAAVHADAFDLAASEQLAQVGVDTGMAGIFDAACVRGESLVEGILDDGRGAVSRSGAGDRWYPVYGARRGDAIAKLRIAYLLEEPARDDLVAAAANAKPYRASATFAAGDLIDHAKLGRGAVEEVTRDGKIVVRFADATRTLVHGRR